MREWVRGEEGQIPGRRVQLSQLPAAWLLACLCSVHPRDCSSADAPAGCVGELSPTKACASLWPTQLLPLSMRAEGQASLNSQTTGSTYLSCWSFYTPAVPVLPPSRACLPGCRCPHLANIWQANNASLQRVHNGGPAANQSIHYCQQRTPSLSTSTLVPPTLAWGTQLNFPVKAQSASSNAREALRQYLKLLDCLAGATADRNK